MIKNCQYINMYKIINQSMNLMLRIDQNIFEFNKNGTGKNFSLKKMPKIDLSTLDYSHI